MLLNSVISIAQYIPIGFVWLPLSSLIGGSGHYGVVTRFLSIPQVFPVTPGVGFLNAD
jgi:hypothetical protein